MTEFKDELNTKIGIYISKLYIDGNNACECKICINPEKTIWSISSWHTNNRYMHQGYGSQTLKHTLQRMYDDLHEPEQIRYIWNGANQYVMDWLEQNFTPVSLLPIATQKKDDIDDWDAHIYILDKQKVLTYFNI